MRLRIDCYLVSLAKSLIVDIDEADIKDREDSEAHQLRFVWTAEAL